MRRNHDNHGRHSTLTATLATLALAALVATGCDDLDAPSSTLDQPAWLADEAPPHQPAEALNTWVELLDDTERDQVADLLATEAETLAARYDAGDDPDFSLQTWIPTLQTELTPLVGEDEAAEFALATLPPTLDGVGDGLPASYPGFGVCVAGHGYTDRAGSSAGNAAAQAGASLNALFTTDVVDATPYALWASDAYATAAGQISVAQDQSLWAVHWDQAYGNGSSHAQDAITTLEAVDYHLEYGIAFATIAAILDAARWGGSYSGIAQTVTSAHAAQDHIAQAVVNLDAC